MSLRMKNLARAGVVAVALATGIAFAGSAMAETPTLPPPPPTTVAGVGHVVVDPACLGATGVEVTGYNDVPESGSITLMVHDNLTGQYITLANVSNGSPVTMGLPMDVGQSYSLTATGPGDYSHLFSGTLECGSTPTPTPTAPAVVPVTAKAATECAAGKYAYSFTNPNDVAVMVKSSGFDDAVRTETVVPAGGTVTVASTLDKLYYETYVSGVQVPESATYVSAPVGLKCTVVVSPSPSPSTTTPAVVTPVPTATSTSTSTPVVKARVVSGPKVSTDYVSSVSGSSRVLWSLLAAVVAVAAFVSGTVIRRRKVRGGGAL